MRSVVDPWMALLGLDPAGPELAALCALAAVVLGGLLGGGFVLLARAERGSTGAGATSAGAGARPAAGDPRELGVLALWRLERAVRAGSGHASAARPATTPRGLAHVASSRHRVAAPIVGERP